MKRLKMDNSEEPQKKIFKARKTMKASDRQQLEAIHKAKEEILKPTELKLLNGNHENGDSDIKSSHRDLGYMAGKKEINGILDVNSDIHEVPIVKLSDIRGEGLRNSEQTKDLKVTLDLQPVDSLAHKENEENVGTVANDSEVCKEEEKAFLIKVDQKDSEDLPEDNIETNDTAIPGEKTKLDISMEEEIDVISGTICAVEDESLKDMVSVSVMNESIVLSEKESKEGNVLDTLERISELHDLDSKDDEVDISKDPPQYELESTNVQRISEVPKQVLSEMKVNATDCSTEVEDPKEMAVAKDNLEQNQIPDAISVDQNAGEEAISSSMEVDQDVKGEEKSSSTTETVAEKSLSDLPSTDLEILDPMETDDIIPILEKLAPVEDELNCFSRSDLTSDCDVNVDEHKADLSPSKQENGDALPNKGFLVLSDEEETSDPLPAERSLPSPQVPSIDNPEDQAEKVKEQKEAVGEQELHGENTVASQRKRSLSEDLDSTSCKKRRYDGDEYEAELQVQITAGDDLNKKLHKVIQKMLDEKLSILKCTVFDTALADLKNRVEKIECKKHEDVLHAIQAKIARLTKRFGAAKEDLKKRPEQTASNRPASPEKTANEATPSSNSVSFRNGNTVRQMLESKRNVGEPTPTATFQSPATGPTLLPSPSSLPLRNSNTTSISVNQSTPTSSLQARAPPDWKLIQAKINASSIGTSQSPLSNPAKPSPPVTSAPVISSVLPAPSTATVVGNNQVSSSSTQPMSVSLQSLPVILHVPVAMQSQSQIMQGTTGTLVTNQQSGNVEFIPVQNQSAVSLNKTTPGTLATTKPTNGSSMPSPGIQRNSPASSIPSTLAVQSATPHSVQQLSRQSLQTVGTTSTYNQANNRMPSQLKSPVSGFNSSSSAELPSTSRQELQANRTPIAETSASKRSSDPTAPGGKTGSSVIDLTLDDEEQDTNTQDSRRTSSAVASGSMQSSQIIGRPTPAQVSQPTSLQTPSAATGPSQTTIHVLPTAQTTVNITQRPGTQVPIRAPAPRPPNNQQMVYTTTTVPTVPVSTAVRSTLMQTQNLRQISPQTGGVPVRMPQTTAYVVNNGVPMGTAGPQLTVHHRPAQESVRPIHPAPLPEAPQPQRLPAEAAAFSAPQKPHLKLARVQSQNGIVLSWSVLEVDRSCAAVDSYHLYAYHEDPTATSPSQWKKIGEVKALPLPMACTLTQFVSGSKYYFAVRAKDIYGRFGPFCDPQSTDVISTQSS
uniref:Activating transcription factor 7 interacting protein n=2 Tax=Leptobrachium leishanense TaxID=445787 RepID=A0A8C5WEE3_9ANUR